MNLALLTDLYELTMAQGYYLKSPQQYAVFDMFFRRPPFDGGFTIFAGLHPLIDVILNLKFTSDELSYLESLRIFKKEFLNYLEGFRFNGDICAFKEGSVVFPNEPLIRVSGKLIEAQLIESMLLNFINYQSLIATKTARIVLASNGGRVLEFGLRRAHGVDGAISAARASFIGGASATSNVLAGKLFNIPVSGTMAHSWIMSFEDELTAFEGYAEIYPENCILLVDTYDTLKSGIPNAITVFRKLKEKGIKNFGIRLDSGDLDYLSKEAKRLFNEQGLDQVKIYASNELDEWIINQITKNKSPIGGWGVGSKLVTGDKDPFLTGVYKIVAKGDGKKLMPCIKVSNNPEKMSNPGIKNIFRFYDKNNIMLGDLIYLEGEEQLIKALKSRAPIKFNHPSIDYAFFKLRDYARAEVLLKPVVKNGKKLRDEPELRKIQEFVKQELNSLDSTYKRLINPHIYKVSISDKLKELKQKLINKYATILEQKGGD